MTALTFARKSAPATRWSIPALCAAALLALPVAAEGQAPVALSGGVEVVTTQLARDGTLDRQWTGSILGARGGVTLRRFSIEGRYAQGTLTPEIGTLGEGEDIVDGSVQLRVRVLPWLTVGAGPHLRAFITPAGSSRWTRIEASARGEGEVINGLVFAHFEGWYALAVDANVPGGGTGAQGGEAGLSLRHPRAPLALVLSYTADRAVFANGGSEFLEGVSLAVAFGRF